MSISCWMDQEIVICMLCGILPTHKKGANVLYNKVEVIGELCLVNWAIHQDWCVFWVKLTFWDLIITALVYSLEHQCFLCFVLFKFFMFFGGVAVTNQFKNIYIKCYISHSRVVPMKKNKNSWYWSRNFKSYNNQSLYREIQRGCLVALGPGIKDHWN